MGGCNTRTGLLRPEGDFGDLPGLYIGARNDGSFWMGGCNTCTGLLRPEGDFGDLPGLYIGARNDCSRGGGMS